jgi:hypothetical protein
MGVPARVLAWLGGCAAMSAAMAQVTFVEVTTPAGLDGIPQGQIAWGDYDNDGFQDLLIACRQLYRNGGPPDFVFTDVTASAGLGDTSVNRGVWGDYDNDGFLDIYCPGPSSESNQDPNRSRLWRNNGDGTFTEEADRNDDGINDHVNDPYNGTAAAWGDADADGFIDLYVGNYEWVCTTEDCGRCYPDYFWHNNGDGTFSDWSTAVGLRAAEAAWPGQEGPGLCVRGINWGDYNNDGALDIFVSMYRLDPNFLLENDGNGNFTDVAVARNADGDEDAGSWGHVLGSAWGDMDNDGDLDLYTANLAHDVFACAGGHDTSQALRNEGAAGGYGFTDTRLPREAPANGMWGWNPCDLARPQLDFAEACPAWADYDNDGNLDLYIGQINNGLSTAVNNISHLYRNDGSGNYTDTSAAHGADLRIYDNTTVAWADYDNDGDLDLATRGKPTSDGTNRMRLYRNDGGNASDWAVVTVVGSATTPGTGTNVAGIGVRVTLTEDAVSMIREVEGGHGYHASQNSLPVEFGLGAPDGESTFDTLDVRWTTGVTHQFSQVPRNRMLVVHEAARTLRRGTDPAVDPLPVLDGAARLFPYTDPVLNDGNTYFYRIDGAVTIRLDKDPVAGTVLIELD